MSEDTITATEMTYIKEIKWFLRKGMWSDKIFPDSESDTPGGVLEWAWLNFNHFEPDPRYPLNAYVIQNEVLRPKPTVQIFPETNNFIK